MSEIVISHRFPAEFDRRLNPYPIDGGYPYRNFVLPTTTDLLNQRKQNYIEVGIGNYGFDQASLATFTLLHCQCLILRSAAMPTHRGLVHILSGKAPYEEISILSSKFPQNSLLQAMIIRTENNPDTRPVSVCEAAGIEILNIVDAPRRANPTPHGHTALFKDVLVTPTRGEVILNIEEMGMQYFQF